MLCDGYTRKNMFAFSFPTQSCANRRSAANRARSRTCVRKRASAAAVVFSIQILSSKCAWEGRGSASLGSAFVTIASFRFLEGSSLTEGLELCSGVGDGRRAYPPPPASSVMSASPSGGLSFTTGPSEMRASKVGAGLGWTEEGRLGIDDDG